MTTDVDWAAVDTLVLEQPPECVCLDTRKAAWLQAPPDPSPPAFGFASGSTSWMPRAVATGAQHRASELPADV